MPASLLKNLTDCSSHSGMTSRLNCLPSKASLGKASVEYSGHTLASSLVKRSRAKQVLAMAASGAPIKLLGISGSLRKGSFNTGVLRAAAKLLPPEVEFTIAEIGDLPLLNTDLEGKNAEGGLTFPDVVEKWRKQVGEADAFLFSCPEYNYAVTPALKNAIDWASRQPNKFDDKAAAAVSTGGGYRGVQSTRVLRLSGIFLNLHFINKPEVAYAIRDPGVFDPETGDLISEQGIQRLQPLLDSLIDWTRRIQR